MSGPADAVQMPAPPRRRTAAVWFLCGFGVAAAIAAGAAILSARRATEAAAPRTPEWQVVVDERFDSPQALAGGWHRVQVPDYKQVKAAPADDRSWRVEGGALIGEDHQGQIEDLARTDLPGGAMRASWRLTAQTSPLNLNCFVGAPNRLDGYTIHVGGWGRPDYVAVTRRSTTPGSADVVLDACTLAEPLQTGRSYAVALEFDHGTVRFAIDGFALLSCTDPEPVPGCDQGGFGFEVSYNTVRIDDLHIAVRRMPHEASPLMLADALASAGAYSQAAAAYRGFIRTWPQDPQVPAARLRYAVAMLHAGFPDEALPLLEGLLRHPDHGIAVNAHYQRLRTQAPGATDEQLDAMLAGLAAARPDATISRLAMTVAGDALAARHQNLTAEQALAIIARMRRWTTDFPVGRIEEIMVRCAERLNQLGRHEDVLDLVPEPPLPNVNALLALGRYDEVHRRYPAIQWARYFAYSDTCGFQEGLGQLREPYLRGHLALESGVGADDPLVLSGFDRANALARTEGAEAALRRHPGDALAISHALLDLGRAEEALAIAGQAPAVRGLALLQLGRYDEADDALPADDQARCETGGARAVAALAAGDNARARRLARIPADYAWNYAARWNSILYDPCFTPHFSAFILPALIAWQADGTDPRPAWQALSAMQTRRASLRVDHRWLGLLGALGADAVLQQPFRSGGHPAREAALIAALRADLAGEAATGDRWRAYLALATPYDVAARAWARLRLERLAAGPIPPR